MAGISENLPFVQNGPNRTALKAFQIDGLFGCYQVRLDFEKTANIFIGENGLGKTTILRCLYYVLTEEYSKLREMPFEELSLLFQDGETCSISRENLLKNKLIRRIAPRSADNTIDPFIYDWLMRRGIEIQRISIMRIEALYKLAKEISDHYVLPYAVVRERLSELRYLSRGGAPISRSDKSSVVNAFRDKVRNHISENIIYLPTSRRIENSPGNLQYEEDDNFHSLIHFGMKDVQKSIDAVLNEIRTQTMHGYNNMAGILLKEYSEGTRTSEITAGKHIDSRTAGIVLDRLGNEIDSDCKENILRIIQNRNISDPEYVHLRNLMQRLIDNYKKLEAYDDRINNFANTCNRYLRDKMFRYDPSNLTISVCVPDIHDQPIPLHQLSSGEKQIVSLFSMLYLTDMANEPIRRKADFLRKSRNIIIIDEPELSLSIDWQKRLLPDIIRSGNCDMLLAVTHSPFIFDNEFDMDAKEIPRELQKFEN